MCSCTSCCIGPTKIPRDRNVAVLMRMKVCAVEDSILFAQMGRERDMFA